MSWIIVPNILLISFPLLIMLPFVLWKDSFGFWCPHWTLWWTCRGECEICSPFK